MPIKNRKISFQLSEVPAKDRKITKSKKICLSDNSVKITGNKIQKALSCDFKKSSLTLKKNEKTKKSISGCEGKLISKAVINEKKHKSWNHFQDFSSEILSKTSLAQRVSDVLSKEKEKSLLNFNLSTKTAKKANCTSLLNNQAKKINGSTESSQKAYGNEQLPEKSLSFQHLQYPSKVMDVSKSISYTTGSFKKPDKNFSSLQPFKNNPVDKTETMTNHYRSSLWDHMEPSDHLPNLRSLCNEKPTPVLSRYNMGIKPVWRYRMQPHISVIEKVTNQSAESFTNEISKSEKKSPQNNDLFKNYNNKTLQQTHTMKQNLKICQCPHFHTEEGIKKVCLQSSPEEQEFGQKFFRVNYIPKEEVDGSDEEKEYVDSWTATEDEKIKPKITKNESVKKTISLKTKNPEIIQKNSQQNCKPKNSVSQNPKSTHLRETAKSLTGTKEKGQVKEKEETNFKKTAGVEVETLRKLFTKLKSVEHLLKEDKCPKSSKNTSEKNSQKDKAKEVSDIDMEDEFKLQTKKLKAEIVRHVQNWLDAEFNDS